MLAQGDNIKGIQQDLTTAAKGAGYCYTPKNGLLLQTALQKALQTDLTTTAPGCYCKRT